MKAPKPGTVAWFDLTVRDADTVRDFYCAVAGWSPMSIEMGGYNDYCMMPPGSKKPAGGICHARGVNADLPPQWLIYITVPNLAASLKACVAKGGKVLRPATSMGGAKMAVVRDPAGAVAALFQAEKAKVWAKKKR